MCRSINLTANRSIVQRHGQRNHLALPRGIGFAQRHDPLPHRGHLRPHVVVDDRGDDVAAERGPDLQQQFLVHLLGPRFGDVLDLQVGAVGRHAGPHAGGHARRQVAAQRRGAVEHDLRLVLSRSRGTRTRRTGRLVVLQPRVLHHVHVIDALGDQLLRAMPRPRHPISTAPAGTCSWSASSRALPHSSSTTSRNSPSSVRRRPRLRRHGSLRSSSSWHPH